MTASQSEAAEKWIEPQPERVMSEVKPSKWDYCPKVGDRVECLTRHGAAQKSVVTVDAIETDGVCAGEDYFAFRDYAFALVTPAPGENE